MSKLIEIALIMAAVIAVAVADVLIKKVAVDASGFFLALKNPLMAGIVALYLVQILIFTYLFLKKAELGVVGIIQIALYAVIVIGCGVIFFQEQITPVKGVGMVLAILGVILTSY